MSRSRLLSLTLLALTSMVSGRQLQRAEWGAPSIAVTHANGKWVIAGRKNAVTLSESDLSISVQAGAASWSMRPSARGDMIVRTGSQELPLRLADARKIAVTRFDTG